MKQAIRFVRVSSKLSIIKSCISFTVPAVLTDYPEARSVVLAASDGSPFVADANKTTIGWLFKCSAYGRPRPVIDWEIHADNTSVEVMFNLGAAFLRT